MLTALPALAGCGSPPAEPEVERERFAFDGRHMGTVFRIVLYAPDAATAEAAGRAALARVAELDATLSDFDPDSELSRLVATAGSGDFVPVSDDLYYMLERSIEFAQATDGAFDITVGPVVRLWRRARRQGRRPEEQRLAEAIEATGYEHIELDEEHQAARLNVPNMRLDLGGIAKGWATDEALDVLRGHGIHRALVDGGGDIALGDPPPGQAGWRIAVHQAVAGDDGPDDADLDIDPDIPAEPKYLIAHNLAVTTSGDLFQAVEIEGVRYSHIIDPRTGEPTTTPMAITVIADAGDTADALASAIAVMGVERGLAFTQAIGAAALVSLRDETGRVQRHQTTTLDAYTILPESELPARDEP